MKARLTDRFIRGLVPPDKDVLIVWDEGGKGFGLAVTPGGAKSFFLNYRTGGRRQRRQVIGAFGDLTTAAARNEARDLRVQIGKGADPLADKQRERDAETIGELCDKFEAEYLPGLKESTQYDYANIIKKHIRPRLGRIKVAKVRKYDVQRWHAKIAKDSPIRANRAVAVLSKLFAFAIDLEIVSANPASRIKKSREQGRERFLSPDETARLDIALARPGASAAAVKLLMLTGSRSSEVFKAEWSEFDIAGAEWRKPSRRTKDGKTHTIPLNAAALAVLSEMRGKAGDSPYLFPGPNGKPLGGVKRFWASVCREAGLANLKLHDLRHNYASVLVSAGLSLPIIGRLLGHGSPQTTHRYAHFSDDPLREATERAGALITGGPGAEVIPEHRGGRQ